MKPRFLFLSYSTYSTSIAPAVQDQVNTIHVSTLFPQVPKLIEGREYIIRIMAQNMYGISQPLLSAETKARDIFSKMCFFKKNLFHLNEC